MARYKLPDVLGGRECVVHHGMAREDGRVDVAVDGVWLTIALRSLTEVPPPIPDEPEPGAYMRNGQIIVGAPVDPGPAPGESRCAWFVYTKRRSWFNHLRWEQAVDETGGPDAEIVPLLPDPAHGVTLPWSVGQLLSVQLLAPGQSGYPVRIAVNGESVYIPDDEADAMAAALIAAARKAREAS